MSLSIKGNYLHILQNVFFQVFNVSFVLLLTSTVSVKELEVDKKKTYKIVGKDEADISKNLIYFRSPIGKALIGKNLADMVIVETPSGEKTFEVLDIQYI